MAEQQKKPGDLPMRDGNRYRAAAFFARLHPGDLPMRDGNHHHSLCRHIALDPGDLPMRDGNAIREQHPDLDISPATFL